MCQLPGVSCQVSVVKKLHLAPWPSCPTADVLCRGSRLIQEGVRVLNMMVTPWHELRWRIPLPGTELSPLPARDWSGLSSSGAGGADVIVDNKICGQLQAELVTTTCLEQTHSETSRPYPHGQALIKQQKTSLALKK